ncbi:MAG: SpoIIE family protein phosphatase, partial [Anaerolineae bacterium]
QEGGKSASIIAGAEGQGLQCRSPERLALTVGHIVEVEDLNRRWRRRVYDGTEVLSSQLRAAAMLMDRVAGDLLTPEKTPVFSMPRKIGYDIGVAGKNKKGAVVSGDTVLAREIRNNRLLLALSDGMGAGAPAAGESRTTVELVEMLMDAGFDRDTTVKTVNSVMMTRSNGEAFATLDMGLVDLVTGDAEFVKIGACPSFIKRGNEVSVIKAQSLPVGILANIPIEAIPRTLVPGDVLVMVTDGVLQARKDPSPKESWVASFISRTRWGSPQDLAEKILERSLGGASRGAGTQQKEASDDMTVLCVAFHPVQ